MFANKFTNNKFTRWYNFNVASSMFPRPPSGQGTILKVSILTMWFHYLSKCCTNSSVHEEDTKSGSDICGLNAAAEPYFQSVTGTLCRLLFFQTPNVFYTTTMQVPHTRRHRILFPPQHNSGSRLQDLFWAQISDLRISKVHITGDSSVLLCLYEWIDKYL